MHDESWIASSLSLLAMTAPQLARRRARQLLGRIPTLNPGLYFVEWNSGARLPESIQSSTILADIDTHGRKIIAEAGTVEAIGHDCNRLHRS
jgi:hypothetical protein